MPKKWPCSTHGQISIYRLQLQINRRKQNSFLNFLMSELTIIFGKILTSVSDKQFSGLFDLAKYAPLQGGGGSFEII